MMCMYNYVSVHINGEDNVIFSAGVQTRDDQTHSIHSASAIPKQC